MILQLIIGSFIIVKVFNWLTLGICKSENRIDGKTVLITGANQGLGKEVAIALAKRGGRIIMACRNLQRAEAARKDVVLASGNENVVVKKLDVSSFPSVRQFAQEFLSTEDRLDILIHNAGIYPGTLEPDQLRNENGIEVTLATNHLGSFLLTHLLMDLLKRTGKARIIIHSSLFIFTVFTKWISFDNEKHMKTSAINKYAVSKYANLLFTRELSRKLVLENSDVTVNCLHPGVIATNIFDTIEYHYRLLNIIMKQFFKTIDQGIQTTMLLAVSDDVEKVSGKYFQDCVEYNVSVSEKEMENAKEMWKWSEKMVGLQEHEHVFGKTI